MIEVFTVQDVNGGTHEIFSTKELAEDWIESHGDSAWRFDITPTKIDKPSNGWVPADQRQFRIGQGETEWWWVINPHAEGFVVAGPYTKKDTADNVCRLLEVPDSDKLAVVSSRTGSLLFKHHGE